MATPVNYWLMKSEPAVYSIEDLKEAGNALWDGIRNYQARNYLRKMRLGDKAFFYHSRCSEPGIVGEMSIVGEHTPDPLQFDKNSKYYDSSSDPHNPRWQAVTVQFEKRYARVVTLKQLRTIHELSEFVLLRKGNRLSVMPVNSAQWSTIQRLLNKD